MASTRKKVAKSIAKRLTPTKKWDSSMSKMPNMTKALEKLRGKPFKSQKELDDYLVETNKGRTPLSERVKNLAEDKSKSILNIKEFDPVSQTEKISKEIIAKRKLNKKHGGKITSRMTGGQVVSHGYD